MCGSQKSQCVVDVKWVGKLQLLLERLMRAQDDQTSGPSQCAQMHTNQEKNLYER